MRPRARTGPSGPHFENVGFGNPSVFTESLRVRRTPPFSAAADRPTFNLCVTNNKIVVCPEWFSDVFRPSRDDLFNRSQTLSMSAIGIQAGGNKIGNKAACTKVQAGFN